MVVDLAVRAAPEWDDLRAGRRGEPGPAEGQARGYGVFHYGNWPALSTTAIRMTAFPASVPACMVLPFTATSRSPMYW